MVVVWGARAADARAFTDGAAFAHQDDHGAAVGGGGIGRPEQPPRLDANCNSQVHDGFSPGFPFYYDHRAFSHSHVHPAQRTLTPLVVNATPAPDLDDDDGDGCSVHTAPITPYDAHPVAHGHFLQPSPGPDSRRSSLAFNEEQEPAMALATDHHQPRLHSLLPGRALGCGMGEVDDTASGSCPSRPPSSRSDGVLNVPDHARPRMVTHASGLVLRQAPNPGQAADRDQAHMALDHPRPGATGLARADESGNEPMLKRAEEIPASTSRRPRGRPRLETSDETPSDRRRTQVRLAQRGFRQRKEEHLKGLERRCEELQNINNCLCAEFARFHELARAERLLDNNPVFAKRLHVIAERFYAASLAAREARCDGGGGSQRPGLEKGKTGVDRNDESSFPLASQTQQGYFAESAAGAPAGPNMPFPLSTPYDMVTQQAADGAGSPFYSPLDSISSCLSGPYYDVSPCSDSSSPVSLVGHETFGRRLQRASLEAGWRLITMTHPPAERYAATFGFRLFFESRETIIRWLKLFAAGPLQFDAMPTRDERLDQRMRMLFPGFEREFLHVDEVETYLSKLGISIPAQSQYVEAEVHMGSLEEGCPPWSPFADVTEAAGSASISASESMARSCSEAQGSATWPMDGLEGEKQLAASGAGNVGQMAASLGGRGTAEAAARFSTSTCMWASSGNWSRARIAIDVNLLMNELVHKSVCLGKIPGVRRRDVNQAIKLAAGLAAK